MSLLPCFFWHKYWKWQIWESCKKMGFAPRVWWPYNQLHTSYLLWPTLTYVSGLAISEWQLEKVTHWRYSFLHANSITRFSRTLVFHSIFSIRLRPPLSYFHGKKLRKREATNANINSAGTNSKNIVNNVGSFNDNALMHSIYNKWFQNEQCPTPPESPSANSNVRTITGYSCFVRVPRQT